MTIKSEKLQLIWSDIKSWAITSALFLGPIIAVNLIELAMKQDFGSYTDAILLVLGALLKLAQKWVKMNTYKAN